MRPENSGGERNKQARTLFVSSLEKGFRVLGAFQQGRDGPDRRDLSLGEIARLSGLDNSAAQRFTNTLLELGYLEKDPRTRRYRPSIELLEFAFNFLIRNRLAEIASPRLIELSDRVGGSVNLCELVGTDIAYTIRIPHIKTTYRMTIPGRRLPAFYTAGGIVILANRPEAEIEAVLGATDFHPWTEWTITDPVKVRERIKTALTNGFDISVQQGMRHNISTAAPVLDSNDYGIAAVQLSVFMPEWTVARVSEEIVPVVTETARVISGILADDN